MRVMSEVGFWREVCCGTILFGSENEFSSLTLGPVITVFVAPYDLTFKSIQNLNFWGSLSKFTTFILKYFFFSEGFLYSIADATILSELLSRLESSNVAPLELLKIC